MKDVMSRAGAPTPPGVPLPRPDPSGDLPGAVLVVEDDAVLAALLEDTLADLGHRVAVARNGTEALHLVRGGRPACILLDLQMPVMDGAAFVAAYRIQVQAQAHGGVGAMAGDRSDGSAAPVILLMGLGSDEAAATRRGWGWRGSSPSPTTWTCSRRWSSATRAAPKRPRGRRSRIATMMSPRRQTTRRTRHSHAHRAFA